MQVSPPIYPFGERYANNLPTFNLPTPMYSTGDYGTLQRSHQPRMDIAIPGMLWGQQDYIIRPHYNSQAGSAIQETAIALGTPKAGDKAQLLISGAPITINVSDPTKAQQQLIDAINLNPVAFGFGEAKTSGTNVTYKAHFPNKFFPVVLVQGWQGLTISTNGQPSVLQSIPFGVAVAEAPPQHVPQQGLELNRGCKLPSSESDIFAGVSVITHTMERFGYGFQALDGFIPGTGHAVDVLSEGDIYVWLENLVRFGDPVFYRYAPDGTFNQLGAFSNTPGQGKKQLPAAKWLTNGFPSAQGQVLVAGLTLREAFVSPTPASSSSSVNPSGPPTATDMALTDEMGEPLTDESGSPLIP